MCGPICLLQKMGKQSKMKKQRLHQRKCCTELARTLVAGDNVCQSNILIYLN